MENFRNTTYKVSTDGVIIGKKGIMKTYIDRGYEMVRLVVDKGVRKNMRVHRLVAETYLPNPNNLSQVNHINGIKNDNRVSNLEWTSPKENTLHSVKTGLTKSRKLSMTEVESIRNEYVRWSKNHNTTKLAEKYGVSQHSISKIINNKHYV